MPRGSQAMLVPVGLLLLSLVAGGQCEDTVAATVGRHTMSRIGELLARSECRQLQAQLTGPDRGEREQLPEENNPVRPRRDPYNPLGCSRALRLWLVTAGEVTTWDRLVRGLRQIGRWDIAQELGKNLNQDLSLTLRKNVEEYGRSVRHLASPLLLRGEGDSEGDGGGRGRRAPPVDLGDLRFERRPPPPYTRSLLGWLGPVLSGVLGGFLASLILAAATAYSCHWALGSDVT